MRSFASLGPERIRTPDGERVELALQVARNDLLTNKDQTISMTIVMAVSADYPLHVSSKPHADGLKTTRTPTPKQ